MHGTGAAASARTSRTITVGKKEYELGKLVFKDFATAREQARAEYVRGLIQTYTQNMDLVPENLRPTIVQETFERAEKITADSLPPKKAWLPKRDKNGKEIRNREARFFHKESNQWIETGEPLLEEQEIEYSGWWLSQTNMGRIFAAWLSMRKCPGQEHMTLDDVSALFSEDEEMLAETANAVGDISQQRLGNSQPQVAAAAGA